MKSFNVLFVEDDVKHAELILQLQDSIDGLVVDHAPSTAEAMALLADHFYHLAIVDVSLLDPNGEPDDFGGLHVLRRLRELRPFCERLLFTTINDEDRLEVLEAFFPERGDQDRLVHGFVDKAVTKLRAHEIVQDRAARWLETPVEIPAAERVLDHFVARGFQGLELSAEHGFVVPTGDEIETVLARLFGQGRVRPVSGIDSIDLVELEMISQGWSKSAVLWCEPSIGDRPGPRCLVKVGPREDTMQEVERYESYVRFGLGVNNRVELLNAVMGDTIGAACYTHLAARGEQQHDLQHLFDHDPELALEAIERLFDPEFQSWTADRSSADDMAGFFVREYRKPLRHLTRGLRQFLERAPELTASGDRSMVDWDGRSLRVPSGADLGLAAFSRSYGACIVHGDLHGGNVLVTEQGLPVLIDYRNMGRGPRALDFVSLEVSLRMAATQVAEVESRRSELVELERASWQADWGPEARPVDAGSADAPGDAPYWWLAASTIRRLARANHPDLTPDEYAVTAVLRVLRVISAVAPRDQHRLRLLPLLSVLTDVIRSEPEEGDG